MRCAELLILILVCAAAAASAAPAAGGRARPPSPCATGSTTSSRRWTSLTEDIEDLGEPVEEFDLFDQCAFTIGVTQYGTWDGDTGYLFGPGGTLRRPALAMDMGGFGTPQYDFLAFPGEEPPSIECNEDAGEEFVDD